jgi:carboxyl-terminal processing protease
MFSAGAHSEVRAAVEKELHAGARGIVLDLRSNGGGLVEEARLIASIFIEHGTIVSTRGRTQPSQTITAVGDAITPSIPVVVLVDQDTASASEIVTAALQDHHRAIVVGTHTFGKGVFQEEQPLSNGGALDITVGEYFTPNGRNLGGGGVKQGAGITPEVALPSNVVDTPRGLNMALDTLAAKVK